MYSKRRSKSVPKKYEKNKDRKTQPVNASTQDDQKDKKIKNEGDSIYTEQIENNIPNFSNLVDLHKNNKLKFIVCIDVNDTLHQKVRFNWFDGTKKAQEIYNFFGSSEEYKIYWKNKEEIQFLHPVQKIESQISENRALILLFQNQKG